MFGKKAKKQAELEALERRRAAAAKLAAMREESKVYYESEIILDDLDEAEEDEVVEIELVLDAESMKKMAEQGLTPEEILDMNLEEDEDVVLEEDEEEVVEEPVVEEAPVEEVEEPVEEEPQEVPEENNEPEVRYVMDGPSEDDELVRPAKLAKLPNLVDYMLTLNMSKRMKMMVATLLLGAYAKYKDIPREKEILIGCMKKIMMALMNENKA